MDSILVNVKFAGNPAAEAEVVSSITSLSVPDPPFRASDAVNVVPVALIVSLPAVPAGVSILVVSDLQTEITTC
jgi:hypothetical protein